MADLFGLRAHTEEAGEEARSAEGESGFRPPELSAVEEMLHIHVQHGSHWPHVAPRNLKCGQNDGGTEFFAVFDFHLFEYKMSHVARGYHIG